MPEEMPVHPPPPLRAAVDAVPLGAWAVGVSGGADSVALLSVLRDRPGVRPHVVHLDHQLRGADSTADVGFVRDLARRWGLPCTIALRQDLESRVPGLPANPSACYRALRLALFREATAGHGLAGVLVAHHADDQAETVLHRLLRGSGFSGLSGMDAETTVGGLRILRPLLAVRRDALRRHLLGADQPWREDASNASDAYLRNRLRRVLAGRPQLTDDLLDLAAACRAVRDWARAVAPVLAEAFPARQLAGLPAILARESARRWLMARSVPQEELARSPAAADRLVAMAADAAGPPRRHFPGGVLVRRSGGVIGVAGAR